MNNEPNNLSDNSNGTQPSDNAELTSNQRLTARAALLEIASDLSLFHNSNREGYAIVPVETHVENLRINSREFEAWIGQRYFERTGEIAQRQVVSDVLTTLEGRARFDSPCIDTHLRVAAFEGEIYLDLGNDTWQTARITTDGWEIMESRDLPIKFRRTRGMLPLPNPERGGSLDELGRFVNVEGPDLILLKAWMVNAFRPDRPFPILILHGEHGSAKSTTCEAIRSLIDPNLSPLRSLPRSERDLVISANNSWVIAFDNLSGVSAQTSDALCRIATGSGFTTRQLYTDSDEIVFSAMRPILSNGINELATRPDLNDRSIQLTCPTIPAENRRTKDEFDLEFEAARPRILGALLDKVSEALRNLPDVHIARLPRMADFATFGTAAFGNEFLERYEGLRDESNIITLESSSIGPLILRHMEEYTTWDGTASELLTILEDMVGDRARSSKYFPREANQLSRELNRLAPNLRAQGIEVSRGTGANRRNFILRRVSDLASSASSSSPTLASSSSPASPVNANNLNSELTRDDDDDNDDEIHSFDNDEDDLDEGEVF